MENRIAAAIGRYQQRIDGFGGEDGVGLNGQRVGDMHAGMALSLQEFVAFQNAQARAHATGRLSTDEATVIYRALGGEVYQGDWPADTPLATKVTLTQVMGELLAVR